MPETHTQKAVKHMLGWCEEEDMLALYDYEDFTLCIQSARLASFMQRGLINQWYYEAWSDRLNRFSFTYRMG